MRSVATKHRVKTVGIGFSVLLLALSFIAAMSLKSYAASYNMSYSLTYTGVPFAGGAINLANNFTNTGQLAIRVSSISFASDFWSNGTRQITSGLPVNLTTGSSKIVETPVTIPMGVAIGNHVVTATASWQYYDGSSWVDARPIPTSTTVLVSQTLGSLFASFATILTIGSALAAIIVVILVVLVVVLKRRRSSPQASHPVAPAH